MALLSRHLLKIFGSSGGTSEFGKIGSEAAGSPITTKDLDLIQSLTQYLQGLYAITASANEPPRIQDINALYYLITSQMSYLFQSGIPQYLSTEEYYNLTSIVIDSAGDMYLSIYGTDGTPNIGHTPSSSPTYWRLLVKAAGALNKTVASEIYGMTEKTTPVSDDLIVVEDSADSYNKKKVKYSSLESSTYIVVKNATDWAAIIERTGVNTYKIKDGYRSIYFKYLTGGYLISSILSGGDTYAVISTNTTTELKFESGAYINVADTASYLNVTTDDCILENVWLKGLGVSSVAVGQSFLLSAMRVKFYNCKTSNRYSSSDFAGFRSDASVPARNRTAVYNSCNVFDNKTTSSTNYGFIYGYMMNGCSCYNLTTDSGIITACDYCVNVTNFYFFDSIGVAGLIGFSNSHRITNANVRACTTTAGYLTGYISSWELTNCRVYECTSTGGNFNGFNTCYMISGAYIYASTIVGNYNFYGFRLCQQITSSNIDTVTINSSSIQYGYLDCQQISSAYVYGITNTGSGHIYGMATTYRISSTLITDLSANSGNAYGLYSCQIISSTSVTNIASSSGTANGFNTCQYISSSNSPEPANAGNDLVDTVDVSITNKTSTASIWT